ncbi:MAG TPA: peptide-methionine (R)-S-oxide reductase MsrB [Thermotogota bacterium]|nr:peptide-methionine (R)-S-oxide reductase MsrB [Thermotogota bacterium]
MKYQKWLVLIILLFITISFATEAKKEINGIQKELPIMNGSINDNAKALSMIIDEGYRNVNTIYLAGGCFWGVEAYFERVLGVVDAQSGYANGDTENPSYEDVVYGIWETNSLGILEKIQDTGHAETVKVDFNENVISLEEVILHFLRIINPYSVNKQGNDVGVQYRSGIYYTNEQQLKRVQKVIDEFEEREGQRTAIEIEPLQAFYTAEAYHQDYLEKNPFGYCHISLSLAEKPLFDFEVERDMSEEALKERLSYTSYNITQNAGTEYPFTSELLEVHEKGIYVDIASGEPLFSSEDKFTSGTGWPSFTKPITADAIRYVSDIYYYVVEVRSEISGSHLGHVFTDGPKDRGGLRYCINGAALEFIPYEEMEEKGYGSYSILFEK